MSYFNYHAKAKKLIKEGHLIEFCHYDKYNNIENCMVLFFDNHKPIPIRYYRIEEYLNFFKENNIELPKTIDK